MNLTNLVAKVVIAAKHAGNKFNQFKEEKIVPAVKAFSAEVEKEVTKIEAEKAAGQIAEQVDNTVTNVAKTVGDIAEKGTVIAAKGIGIAREGLAKGMQTFGKWIEPKK